MSTTNNSPRSTSLTLCLMGALAMSYGWGFRGDYGHEAGAMIPGALLAMGVCLCSGRHDWFRRCAAMGLCGAIGWAFGGQQSYGQITSYTIAHSFPDVLYGYGALFLVGAVWGGIGGAVLSLSLTLARDELNRFVVPILAIGGVWFLSWLLFWAFPDLRFAVETISLTYVRDTDWLATLLAGATGLAVRFTVPNCRSATNVILLMVGGWLAGVILLVLLFGLQMSPTPPPGVRSDNWGGCVGLFIALAAYLYLRRNRAGIMLAAYGLLAGGIGFSLGDFINKPDKVRWDPFWQLEFLRGFDHWKWSEQSFGLFMGLGVALGLLRLLRGNLRPPNEDGPTGPLNELAAFVLVILMMWWTVGTNVFVWMRPNHSVLPNVPILGVGAAYWCLAMGLALSGIGLLALYRHRQERMEFAPATAFGKGQVLFLLVLWISLLGVVVRAMTWIDSKGVFFVHASFTITALICTVIAVSRTSTTLSWSRAEPAAPEDARWRLSWRYGVLWALVPAYLAVLTAVTMTMHDGPGVGARLRFGEGYPEWRNGAWIRE
jgi:hypothetical protein